MGDDFFGLFRDRHVLFITTKNVDYIRNTQEIAALQAVAASVTVLGGAGSRYLPRLLRVFLRLALMPLRRFDAVFVGFAPQLVLPVFARRFRGMLVAEDFFISLYDTLVCDRRKFRPGTLPARLLHRLDEKTLSLAAHVVADTDAHADYFAREFGVPRARIRTLYLQADSAVYHPMVIAKPASLARAFLVFYFGSVLPLQGVDVILESASLLKGHAGIRFELVGPLSAAQRRRCKGCRAELIPWLDQRVLATHIARADVCLAGHFSADIAKASRTIPGKAYIYEAMQKPMILGDNPANRELFREDAGHRFVRMGDAQALASAILASAERFGRPEEKPADGGAQP